MRFLPPLSAGWHEAAPGPQYGFENEFSLFNPLIQLADILPHSKLGTGAFSAAPHLVEIGIVERPQAGNSAGRLFSKKNKEAAGRRCLFPSPVRRLGIQDAVLDGFRGVVFPKVLNRTVRPVLGRISVGYFLSNRKVYPCFSSTRRNCFHVREAAIASSISFWMGVFHV